MQPTPLPAPFGGIKDDVPIISLQAPYCENLLNFNIVQEGVVLRKGDTRYNFVSAPVSFAQTDRLGLAKYGESNLFGYILDDNGSLMSFLDIDAGTIVHTIAGTANAYFYPLYFNNYLFFLNPTDYNPGVYYNGTVWGNIGYTGSGFQPIGGCVYKNRAYIVQYQDASYWYSNIDAITGALTKVDLNSITLEKCSLTSICTVTLADTVSAVSLLAFVFSNGEVLFYSGSYPNSADWRLEGKAKIAQPIFYNSFIPYQGDSLIICDSGLVSLRDLFLKGSEQAASLTVSSNIETTWREMVAEIRRIRSTPTGPLTQTIRGVWDPANLRIILTSPYYLDSNGTANAGAFYFILDTDLESWSFHRSFGSVSGGLGICDIINYKNKIYYTVTCGGSAFIVYQKEGGTGFTDKNSANSDVAYDYEIKSGPVSVERAWVQLFCGMDVIVKSDLHAQTNYEFIRDFGVQTTTAQKVNAVSGSLQKPFVNAGIEGSYIQYKISGTTTTGKTVGYQLYGTNMWSSQGTSPR